MASGRSRARRHAAREGSNDRGFSLIELVVAVGIFAVLVVVTLAAARALANAAVASVAGGAISPDEQIARWRDEAATAFAVYVPAASDGHEVDFFARDQAQRAYFWKYAWDPHAQTLTRSDYTVPGGPAGVRDPATGALDPTRTYAPMPGIVAFAAQNLDAGDLVTAKSALGPIFANAGIAPQSLPVSFNENLPANDPDVVGGNRVVQIVFATAQITRTVHLATAIAPSGFTIGGIDGAQPAFQTVVWRYDHSVCTNGFLGICLTHAMRFHIYGQVDVSYDNWQTRQSWCDHVETGVHDWLMVGSPVTGVHANPDSVYAPATHPGEQGGSILAACEATNPVPPGPNGVIPSATQVQPAQELTNCVADPPPAPDGAPQAPCAIPLATASQPTPEPAPSPAPPCRGSPVSEPARDVVPCAPPGD